MSKYNVVTQKRNNETNQANKERLKLNGTYGDHLQLDTTVNSGKGITGLTINRDTDRTTTKNSDDYNGISAWEASTKSDYENQKKNVNSAIQNQIQNNKDYQQELDRLNQNANAPVITTDSVNQAFKLADEPDANAMVKILNNNIHYTSNSWAYYFTSDINPYTNNLKGDLFQITFTNLKNSTYRGSKISKIVETVSDSTPTGNKITNADHSIYTNGTSDYFIMFNKNPQQGNMHSPDVTVTYQYYDADGKLIDFSGAKDAWLSIGSLNFDQGNADSTAGVSEGVKAISGVNIKQLAGSSVTVHDDGWAYAGFNNYTGTGINDGPNSWDKPNSPNAYYGTVVFQLNGTAASIREGLRPWGGANIAQEYNNARLNNAWIIAATTLPQTKLQRKTTNVNYHLDKLNVNPVTEKTTQVDYHYDVAQAISQAELYAIFNAFSCAYYT